MGKVFAALFFCMASMAFGQSHPPSTSPAKAAQSESKTPKAGGAEQPVAHTNPEIKREGASIDLWVKAATIGNTVFAFFLMVSTIGLWRVTGRAASAATKSADTLVASERAYVFAEFSLNTFGMTLLDKGNPFGETEVSVQLWNYGKTPAEITMIRGYITKPQADVPHELIEFEGVERTLPPGLGIGSNSSFRDTFNGDFDVEDFTDIKNWNKRIYVVGKMEYRTIHGKECVTGFCWHILYREGNESILTLTRDSKLNVRT